MPSAERFELHSTILLLHRCVGGCSVFINAAPTHALTCMCGFKTKNRKATHTEGGWLHALIRMPLLYIANSCLLLKFWTWYLSPLTCRNEIVSHYVSFKRKHSLKLNCWLQGEKIKMSSQLHNCKSNSVLTIFTIFIYCLIILIRRYYVFRPAL